MKKRDNRLWVLIDPDRLAEDVAAIIEDVGFNNHEYCPRWERWKRTVYQAVHDQIPDSQNQREQEEKAVMAGRAGLTVKMS